MINFKGNLDDKFKLNIKEEPDFDNKIDSKDDSLVNKYTPPNISFSSKSLQRISKKTKHRVKFDIYKKPKILNKIDNNPENKSYLKIFQRKSFRGLNNYQSKKFVNYKASYKENFTVSESEDISKSKSYEYPTNIFNQFFFAWTIKLFRQGQRLGQLKIMNLGKFSEELSSDEFLK